MSTIKQVIQHLEQLAPPVYQESYDNCGLLTGDANWALTQILVTLDCTEAIVDEAVAKGCCSLGTLANKATNTILPREAMVIVWSK